MSEVIFDEQKQEELKELEEKIISKGGANRGQIKTSAEPTDVDRYHELCKIRDDIGNPPPPFGLGDQKPPVKEDKKPKPLNDDEQDELERLETRCAFNTLVAPLPPEVTRLRELRAREHKKINTYKCGSCQQMYAGQKVKDICPLCKKATSK